MATGKLEYIREGIAGAAIIAFALLTPFLKHRRERWGATDTEIHRSLPGDDLVPNSKGGYTHAITIHAAAAEVWPWILQLGQNKGGFYSYELLENIVGCKIHNADEIVPEFQDTAVGDKVAMSPKGAPYLVAAIDPGRTFVLQLRANLQTQETVDIAEPLPEKYQDSSWLFFPEETIEETTRLITRSRNDWNQSRTNTFFYGIFRVISLEMDRKMLKGIKQRAEARNKSKA